MKITVETVVKAKLSKVWEAWNNPEDIKQWNTAQDDWHTTRSTVDLREGGKFLSRMEAKDGSAGFDFEGTYTCIVPHKIIEYRMSDGRGVKVEFVEHGDRVLVKTAFDAENENPPEMQRAGWQAISDNFRRYVEENEKRPPVCVAHVVLETDRMDESGSFVRTIGMRPVFEGPEVSVYELRGGTHLILMRKDNVIPGNASFDLMVDDLRATHQLFSSLGLAPSSIEARPAIDHEVFTVREPAGHVITFFSSHTSGKPV